MLSRLKTKIIKIFYYMIAYRLPSSYLPGWNWTRKVRSWSARGLLESSGKNINIEPHVDLHWGGDIIGR